MYNKQKKRRKRRARKSRKFMMTNLQKEEHKLSKKEEKSKILFDTSVSCCQHKLLVGQVTYTTCHRASLVIVRCAIIAKPSPCI